MSPGLLAADAQKRGIKILALTDHNASLNCPPFALACARKDIFPLFGMELCSVEEVHLLALFPDPKSALVFGSAIHKLLPDLAWDPEAFGDQAVVDETEGLLELHPTYLGAALEASFDELAYKAADAGALVIPAHVDRAMFSVQSQLGFLPPGPYDAVESVFTPGTHLTGGRSVISGSDAHYPEHIGRRPFGVDLPEGAVEALAEALKKYVKLNTLWGAEGPSDSGETDGPVKTLCEDSLIEEAFGGYEELIALPAVNSYPYDAAKGLFEELRIALKKGRVFPSFARGA
jgi:hypothetical protein